MGRAFVYVILGGGVSAGYAALDFVRRGVSHGELCIISDESVAPYERPALSKGYLLPEGAARLPSFHTCVGANEERLTPKWYKEHGVELVLGTGVKSADVKRKTLLTTTGETISYKFLIIATGARALKLEEFGVNGSDAENVCYLRDISDANRLVDAIQSSPGGNAVVIGGGYIGMECAASLVINKINVTMVFPEAHCMARLLTPKIANYYEEYYKLRGVKFIKGTVLSSFDFDSNGKVTDVTLRDGTKLSVDMVVVGIGIRPNTGLFEGQLTLEKGGIKVNGMFQSSNSSVYAIGDVAAFPVKAFGEKRRLEHVDSARKSAKHAVSSIMEPDKTGEFDYIPFFYSRVFTLSWQFYGDNAGEVVYYGDLSASGDTFGAYWVNKGHVVGAFLEGGTKARKENFQQVVEEDRKSKLPQNHEAKKVREEWEVKELEEREKCEKEGIDYERIKALNMPADVADKIELKRKRKKNPDQGFSTYEEMTLRQHARLTSALKPNEESYKRMREVVGEGQFYPTANTLIQGSHYPTTAAMDKLAQDVTGQIKRREQFHRRRMFDPDAPIDYINEKNKRFNEKLEKFYGKYTEDIKEDLERGTAV